jgi:formylglycine-generating enzyme required for sulfatase activity
LKRGVAAGIAIAGTCAALAAIAGVVRLAERERTDPERCGPGLSPSQGRCCPEGQKSARGHCTGRPTSCPAALHLVLPRRACAADERHLKYAGGRLAIGSDDWQTEGVVQPRTALVAPFALDATEVTVERWEHCVRAGACRAFGDLEPGLPVTSVDPREAERFCRLENGRLPTGDEWLFAAMGVEGRRFPWGATGLVCRRVVFGLLDGPCARGGDGATPEGALDMVGNVAEWTTERDGTHVARGGSYQSAAAVDLKSWSAVATQKAARHIGFRCAYDVSAMSAAAP